MLREGNYLSPTYFGESRFEKPILFYWLIILSYKVFGLSWMAARFISMIFASLTLGMTYIIAYQFFNKRIAFLSCLILLTTPMFFRHAKNAVPDMALNFFIVLAIYCVFHIMQTPNNKKYQYFFYTSCALGFMIKGFTAIIIPFLFIIFYALLLKRLKNLTQFNLLLGLGLMAFVITPWFLYMYLTQGTTFMNYVLVQETFHRILNKPADNLFLYFGSTLYKNTLFYAGVIFSYFAPWSIFALGAFPVAISQIKKEPSGVSSLGGILVWIGLVFIFFSFISFRINHYMLPLTTPFALLLSYFFLYGFSGRSLMEKILIFLRKNMVLGIFILGFLLYSFVVFFLLQWNKPFILILSGIFLGGLRLIHQRKNQMDPPLVLGVFILFLFSQSQLLSDQGLTAHASLKKFAKIIQQDTSPEWVIGVGSHDLHEKEFQVYFEQKLLKVATSNFQETERNLVELFGLNDRVYCLITRQDFENFLRDGNFFNLEIVQKDFMVRKRIILGKEFFLALFRLDRKKVYDYLMEEIVLIRKNQSA